LGKFNLVELLLVFPSVLIFLSARGTRCSEPETLDDEGVVELLLAEFAGPIVGTDACTGRYPCFQAITAINITSGCPPGLGMETSVH
jgi:hypothetical protein